MKKIVEVACHYIRVIPGPNGMQPFPNQRFADQIEKLPYHNFSCLAFSLKPQRWKRLSFLSKTRTVLLFLVLFHNYIQFVSISQNAAFYCLLVLAFVFCCSCVLCSGFFESTNRTDQ